MCADVRECACVHKSGNTLYLFESILMYFLTFSGSILISFLLDRVYSHLFSSPTESLLICFHRNLVFSHLLSSLSLFSSSLAMDRA